jgi:hypothetical protein
MRYLKHPLLCGTCQCLVWLAGDAIPSIVEPWSGAARRKHSGSRYSEHERLIISLISCYLHRCFCVCLS